MLQAARSLKDQSMQVELSKQIKADFRRNKDLIDALAVKSLMQEGYRSLQQIQDLASSSSRSTTREARIGNNLPGMTWLQTEDKEDERGRVGEGWPWQ